MNVLRLIIFGLSIIIYACASSNKLPNNGNEIFSPSDLEVLSRADVTKNGHPFLWKCYPLETVRPSFRTWKGADPLGPYDVMVTMCDLKISVSNKQIQNEYSDTRGRKISYCNEFMSAWKKLTTNEKKICIAGRSIKNSYDVKQIPKFSKVDWIWDKIKTKKGCYSFWDAYDCADF